MFVSDEIAEERKSTELDFLSCLKVCNKKVYV